jgi:hypothetical protein
LVRNQLDFGATIGDDEGVDWSLSSLTAKLQLKAVLQKGLQHKPQLARIGFGIFRFPFHIESVRANPTRAAGYLEPLDLIGKRDQHFECYIPATALAVADPQRHRAIGFVRFDGGYRKRRSFAGGGLPEGGNRNRYNCYSSGHRFR